ncbi:MAG: chemotaxis protein CheW [Pirellulales bacterium]|jgi:chemotaxis-related protein WspB
MQLLTFTIDGQQYGLDTRNIVEVLPFISAQELPQQAEEIRGLIRYRGKLLPVLDLCQLILDRPCQSRLGTRTVVIRTTADDTDDTSLVFAITAEDVVGISTTTFDSTNCEHAESFLGPIVDAKSNTTDKLSIQIIVVESLQNNRNLQKLMSYTRQELGQHKAVESDPTR